MSTELIDVRNEEPNDPGYREAQFRLGWSEAQQPDRPEYQSGTLRHLTWRNLGWRLGRLYGKTSDKLIGVHYDRAVRQQLAARR